MSSSARIWTLQGWGLVLLTLLSFHPKLFHIEEYLFFLLLTGAVGTAWWEKQAVMGRSPIDLPLFLLVGWVLFTIPFATDPLYSFSGWRKLLAGVLVFFWATLVLRVAPSEGLHHRVLGAVVIGTAALSLFSLADFWAKGGSLANRTIRAGVPFPSGSRAAIGASLWLGTYMVMAIPLVMALSLIRRAWWERLVCVSALVLALVALFFSYIRGAWIGVIAEALALGLFTRRTKLIWWVLGACLISGIGLHAMLRAGFLHGTLDPASLYVRIGFWKLALGEVIEHPLVGVGYGDHTLAMRLYGYPETKMRGILIPHNVFVMVAAGSGIPALGLLVWILVGAVRSLLTAAKGISDKQMHAVVVGTAVMIVGFAVRNMFSDMFHGSSASLFWILVAVGLGARSAVAGLGSGDACATPVPPLPGLSDPERVRTD